MFKFDLQMFATPLTELFSQQSVLDYTRKRDFPELLGDTLFPAKRVQSLTVDMLLEGDRTPVIADYASFDTEAEIGDREAQKATAELSYIKRKTQIKEEDLIALANPRSDAEQNYVVSQIYNDLAKLVQSVRARGEEMTMQMLATGKIVDRKHGISLNYGVPSAHQKALSGGTTWDGADADILTNLQDWSDSLSIAPTRALTSKKILRTIMRNKKVIAAVYGDNNTGRVLGQADFDTFMIQQGLPVIRAYDGTYREKVSKGKYNVKRYFPENSIVLMNDDLLGEKLYGPTPDESHLIASGAKISQDNQVFTKIFESTQDPVGTWEMATATFLPSFAAVDEVFQATVLG